MQVKRCPLQIYVNKVVQYTIFDQIPACRLYPHADCSLIEAGSEMGTELAGLGLVDVFRELHPWVRAVTRYGSTNQNHCARRLDQFWLTHELAQSPAIRVAIDRHTDSLPSDHRMMTCDLPLDVANTARVSMRVWDPVVHCSQFRSVTPS